MVQNLGNAIPYSGGTTGRPLPIHDPAQPLHTGRQAPRKPTGLDWDAHTPTCKICGQKSGRVNDTGMCPPCRGVTIGNPTRAARVSAYAVLDEHEIAARFTAPTTVAPTSVDQPTDPSPAADTAATPSVPPVQRPLDPATPVEAAAEAHRGEPSSSTGEAPTPVRAKIRRTGPDDILITLRGPGLAARQTEVAALLNDLLTGLHHETPKAPAVAAPAARKPLDRQPATAGTNVAPRTGKGKPARGATPGTTRTPKPRPSKIAPHHHAVLTAYAAGDSPAAIGARIGVTGRAIQDYLTKHHVRTRTRSEAQRLAAAARATTTATPTGDQPA